jgi:L-fuculose-phosphate aldolase
VPLTDPVLPEAAALGPVPEVPYATPGTADAGNAVREAVRAHDAFMMQRHGPVTVGRDPFAAFDRMEAVESVARVLFMARLMGRFQALPADEVERIKLAAAAARGNPCWACTE